MLRSTWLGLGGVAASLLFAAPSLAQCAKDTDCKGERICDAGRCLEPAAVMPAAPAVADASPPAAAATTPTVKPTVVKPKLQRHSTGMMVGGIVMVALAPPALIVSGLSALLKLGCQVGERSDAQCDDSYDPVIYGSLLSAVVLVGVGVPLIVTGAKREPVPATATVSPILIRGGAGLGLRLEL